MLNIRQNISNIKTVHGEVYGVYHLTGLLFYQPFPLEELQTLLWTLIMHNLMVYK